MFQRKIPGAALCGFADFFEDPRPVVGARGQSRGAARGRQALATRGGKPPPPGKSPHRAAVARAEGAAKRAIDAAKAAQAVVQKFDPKKHLPVVPAKKQTTVRGDVVLGAPPPKGLTPKARAAVEKHKKGIRGLARSVLRLKNAAGKAARAGTEAQGTARKVAPIFKQKLEAKGARPPGGTTVRVAGDFGEYGWDESARAGMDYALGQDEGAIDEGAFDAGALDAGAADVSIPDSPTGVVTAPDGTPLYDPAQDPDVVPIPARGQPVDSGALRAVVRKMPEDAIVYGGDRGFPQNSIGSWGVFFQGGPSTRRETFAGEASGDGFILTRSGWRYRSQQDKRDNKFHPVPGQFDSYKALSENSTSRNWGPLVGNPKGDLAGLQYAVDDDKWFWQSSVAPTWATSVVDAKLALANQKTVDANRRAAQVRLAEMMKNAAEVTEEKARQEAAQAIAESQAESEAKQAETKARGETATLEVEERRRAGEEVAAQRQQEAEDRQRAREEAAAQRQQEAEDRARQREEEAERRREETEERKRQREEEMEIRRQQLEEARLAPPPTPQIPGYPQPPALPPAAPEESAASAEEYDPEAAAAAEAVWDEPLDGEVVGVDMVGREVRVDQWGNASD